MLKPKEVIYTDISSFVYRDDPLDFYKYAVKNWVSTTSNPEKMKDEYFLAGGLRAVMRSKEIKDNSLNKVVYDFMQAHPHSSSPDELLVSLPPYLSDILPSNHTQMDKEALLQSIRSTLSIKIRFDNEGGLYRSFSTILQGIEKDKDLFSKTRSFILLFDWSKVANETIIQGRVKVVPEVVKETLDIAMAMTTMLNTPEEKEYAVKEWSETVAIHAQKFLLNTEGVI